MRMKFYINPSHFAKRSSFTIRDDAKNRLFKVKGRFLFGLRTLNIEDMNNELLYVTKRRYTFSPFKRYIIVSDGGDKVAHIKRTYGFFKPKFTIYYEGKELFIKGSLYQHNFSIADEFNNLVSMSKKVFPSGDAYEIDVTTEKKPLLHLFLMITIDQCLHERKKLRP